MSAIRLVLHARTCGSCNADIQGCNPYCFESTCFEYTVLMGQGFGNEIADRLFSLSLILQKNIHAPTAG